MSGGDSGDGRGNSGTECRRLWAGSFGEDCCGSGPGFAVGKVCGDERRGVWICIPREHVQHLGEGAIHRDQSGLRPDGGWPADAHLFGPAKAFSGRRKRLRWPRLPRRCGRFGVRRGCFWSRATRIARAREASSRIRWWIGRHWRRSKRRFQPETKIPQYPAADGKVKLAAAWLVEQAGFSKGYGDGRAGISTRHTLALVNRGGASASEVLALSEEIAARVKEKFGVGLEREPVLLGKVDRQRVFSHPGSVRREAIPSRWKFSRMLFMKFFVQLVNLFGGFV